MPLPGAGEETDEVLAARCQQGDYAAFELLYRRWQRPMLAYLYQLTRNYEDAGCLSQEVFLKVFNHVDRFDTARRFSTWLYTIARNSAIDFREAKSRRKGIPFTDLEREEEDAIGIADRTPAANAPVEERLNQGEANLLLRQAIEGLPTVHREIIELVAIQGMSYEEASRILGGASLGTLRSRMFHALRLLRERLEPVGGTDGNRLI